MPEGDTLFRAARTLDLALRGQRVTAFSSVYPALTRVDVDTPVVGRLVEGVSAAGKHLLMRFEGGLVLRSHLRMSGSWHVYRPGERWRLARARARIVLETAAFVAVGFDVPDASFHRAEALPRSPAGALGPDLLGAELDVDDAVCRLRAQGAREIGPVLLDQHVLAGVGNEYKSEVLFLCGVHPWAPVARLSDEQLRDLVQTARTWLQRNVAMESGRRKTTHNLDPRERHNVYGRVGKPCRRCGTPIDLRKQGEQARLTFWCPRCQPEVVP